MRRHRELSLATSRRFDPLNANPKTFTLVSCGGLGREIPIGFDLVAERMLADRLRAVRDAARP